MDPRKPLEIHIVTAGDSPELSLLRWALRRSSVVGLDAEWKPSSSSSSSRVDNGGDGEAREPSFPVVTLLQIACRVRVEESDAVCGEMPVFLVDLLSVPHVAVWELLKELFVSPSVLKLGFRFKQDLVYLSSTFSSHGCEPGFDRVEPFLDITSIYYHLKKQNAGKKLPKEIASLAAICKEILHVTLAKELQCSDWSCRPLSREQISYAAADAYYLLEIFTVFQQKLLKKEPSSSTMTGGLMEILRESDECSSVLRTRFCKASDMFGASGLITSLSAYTSNTSTSWALYPLDESVSDMIRWYGDKILLKESDKKPRSSRRKRRPQLSVAAKCKDRLNLNGDWQGPPPWDSSFGGDGYPKFLCDVMVEGLARHLRCVGIDAAVPSSKKPDPRQLLDQTYKEKRVLLTRDAKLLKHQYLDRNQVYKVTNLLKNDQLLEVIKTFQLKICEEQLMSRCTKCNGSFIQKPLTTEEAIAASKGFQVIPNCLFNRDIEFWQCKECNQLYWEGTQYHNAVQKFVSVCKLTDD